MILGVVLACEVAFWVLVALGLTCRYRWGRRRLGAVLLAATAAVDLVLLAATVIDLRAGASIRGDHLVAAIYLGVSVGYGPKMVRWADARVAHRVAGGPPARRLHGVEYALECWRDVGRTLVTVGVAGGVLLLLGHVADGRLEPTPVDEVLGLLGLVLGIDLVWAASYSLWPRRPR
jgi:hypothetical protein